MVQRRGREKMEMKCMWIASSTFISASSSARRQWNLAFNREWTFPIIIILMGHVLIVSNLHHIAMHSY
jgi:hypothetical protein